MPVFTRIARAVAGAGLALALLPAQAFAQAASEPVYGPELEEFTYPEPTQQYRFKSQGVDLQMTYMDVRPVKPNGRTVVLMHGKNFCGATWDGTTKALTTYLATVAPEVWTHEPEETWPLRGGQSGDGTAGMIQTVSAATGTIGYADASKVPATLGTVAVGSNGAYVPVSAKAAAAALDAATLGSEADETRLLYQPSHDAEGAYPIVLVSYLAARLRYDDARIAAVVKAYLRFAASTRGQDVSTKATGCAPITRQMREKINAAIDKIAA